MTMHAQQSRRTDGSSISSSPSRRAPDLDALYGRLAEADETEDARALAALAWELYGLLGLDEADLNVLRARLHQLVTDLLIVPVVRCRHLAEPVQHSAALPGVSAAVDGSLPGVRPGA